MERGENCDDDSKDQGGRESCFSIVAIARGMVFSQQFSFTLCADSYFYPCSSGQKARKAKTNTSERDEHLLSRWAPTGSLGRSRNHLCGLFLRLLFFRPSGAVLIGPHGSQSSPTTRPRIARRSRNRQRNNDARTNASGLGAFTSQARQRYLT